MSSRTLPGRPLLRLPRLPAPGGGVPGSLLPGPGRGLLGLPRRPGVPGLLGLPGVAGLPGLPGLLGGPGLLRGALPCRRLLGPADLLLGLRLLGLLRAVDLVGLLAVLLPQAGEHAAPGEGVLALVREDPLGHGDLLGAAGQVGPYREFEPAVLLPHAESQLEPAEVPVSRIGAPQAAALALGRPVPRLVCHGLRRPRAQQRQGYPRARNARGDDEGRSLSRTTMTTSPGAHLMGLPCEQ